MWLDDVVRVKCAARVVCEGRAACGASRLEFMTGVAVGIPSPIIVASESLRYKKIKFFFSTLVKL